MSHTDGLLFRAALARATLFENVLGFCCPYERFGVSVVLFDVFADCQFQLFNAFEDPVPYPVLRDVAKPSFDDVQPGTAGRSEVDVKPLVSLQPVNDFGMLVCRVIVNNQMQVEILRCFRVDLL